MPEQKTILNDIYIKLIEGYGNNPEFAQSLLASKWEVNVPTIDTLINSVLDSKCNIAINDRIDFLKILLSEAKDELKSYACRDILSKVINFNNTDLFDVLLAANDSDGKQIINSNLRPGISSLTAYEYVLTRLKQCKTKNDFAYLKQVVEIFKKHNSTVDPFDQYQCDMQFFNGLRSQVNFLLSAVTNILFNSTPYEDFLSAAIDKELILSSMDQLKAADAVNQLALLERHHVFDPLLLNHISQVRRNLFIIDIKLPIAIGVLDWEECRMQDMVFNDWNECQYVYKDVNFSFPQIDHMLAINDKLITQGAVSSDDIIQIMGDHLASKGKNYINNLCNAICRLKQNDLLFKSEIYDLVTSHTTQLKPYDSFSTANPRAVIEMILILTKSGSMHLMKLLRHAAEHAGHEDDLCFAASIIQKLISLDLISSYYFDYELFTKGTIEFILTWLSNNPHHDPSHLFNSLNKLGFEQLLSHSSLIYFIHKISPRPMQYANYYMHNVAKSFNASQIEKINNHIENYLKDEDAKVFISRSYNRLPANFNETVCYGDLKYSLPLPKPLIFEETDCNFTTTLSYDNDDNHFPLNQCSVDANLMFLRVLIHWTSQLLPKQMISYVGSFFGGASNAQSYSDEPSQKPSSYVRPR